MKIEVNDLYNFVKKASMSGDIDTMYVDVTTTGLHCRIQNESNVCFTDTKLSINTDDDSLGRLFIKNTKRFLKALKTFTGEITLSKEGVNVLKIVGSDNKRTADIILASEKIVENIVDRDMPNIPATRTFTTNKDFLSKILVDLELSNSTEIKIQANKKQVNFVIGTKNESDMYSNSIDVEDGEDVKVSIGEYLTSVYNSVEKNSDLVFKIGTNMPITIIEKTDNIEFTCLIAPIVQK